LLVILKFKNINLLLRSKIEPYLGSDTRLRIAKGAFWGAFGSLATRSITIFLSFILARILGKEGFGEYGIINNTAAMIGGFVGLGLGATVTRYVANLKLREPVRAGKIIGLTSIITWFSAVIYGSVFIYFAPWLATTTLNASHLAPILQISSITIGMGVINSVQISTLTGLESFKVSSILSTIFGIIQSLLVVVFAWHSGVKGAVLAIAITSILNVIAYYFVSRRELSNANIKVTFREAWNEWHVLVKYSLPAFLGTITVGPVIWASNAFLANQPAGYGQLGIFNAALQWDAVVQFLPAMISVAVLPVMADMYGKENKQGSIDLMWKMMRYTALIVIPIALLVSLFSPIIIKAYGSSFAGGHWVIVIVAFTSVLFSISSQLGYFINAAGKMWIGFAINCVWGLTFLILSYYLVKWGAIGLASAKFLAYLFHFIWSLILCFIIDKRLQKSYIQMPL
jgi:O-antigen/teichoic acid export membrane protein